MIPFPDKSERQVYVPLQARISLIGIAIILVFVLGVYMLLLPEMEREKLAEREGKLRAVVGSVLSVLDTYEKNLRNPGQLNIQGMPSTLAEAQARSLDLFGALRYDSNEFFFVLDGQGTILSHPLRPELVGQNMMDYVGPGGDMPFCELVMGSQRDGEAVVNHLWESKYSAEIFEPQLTMAAYYWPWDWVLCSSVYVQDIEDSSRAVMMRAGAYVAAAAVLAMMMLLFFNYFGLHRPLQRLLGGIHAIRRGDLEARIDDTGRDELGYISRQFNAMVDDVAAVRRRIQASEKKYKDLSDLLPDAVYEVDLALKVTYLNKAALAVTGFGREDLLADLPLGRIIPKADIGKIQELFEGSIEDGAGGFILTHKFIRKDGVVKYGENHMVPIHQNGVVRGARGVLRDVTEKVEMERGLLQSQKMETIGTLAGGIAHDFNNVLGAIMGTISLMEMTLRDKGELTREQLTADLGNLNKATSRAADMVKQILGLSRKHTLSLEVVDLNDVLNNVEIFCRSFFDKKIEMDFQGWETGRALVEADPTQLEQILLNLCVNARDAMTTMRPDSLRQGGALAVSVDQISAGHEVLVRCSAQAGRDHWSISVRDEGVGMDQATLESAFDPFFTTKAKGQGTGLGLAMVYNILQQHGGRVDVRTEVGKGTTVCMVLPMVTSASLPGRETSASKSEEQPGPDRELVQGSGLILIIDDDAQVRSIGKRILEMAGYSVLTADDGIQGLQIFEQRQAELDLVLLDMVMPKRSGKDVFLSLQKVAPEVKVLMASGFRMDDRMQEVLDLGAVGFIQKPFGVPELSMAVRKAIGNSVRNSVGNSVRKGQGNGA